VAGHDATDLIGWTSAPVIEPTSAANRLTIRARGADIVLLINGTEVGRVHDDTYQEGRLALGLNNARGEQAEARFANLVITRVQ